MMKDKRKFFAWFALVICLLGLIITFIKYSFDSFEEGFYTKPGAITYTSDTITKWKADASCNAISNEPQQYGNMGVPEKDVLSYIKNKTWPWTDEFIKDITKLMKLSGDSNHADKDYIQSQIKLLQSAYPEQFLLMMWSHFGRMMTYDQFLESAKKKNLTCKSDPSGNIVGSRMYMLDPSGNITNNTVNNEDLPYLIPGFSFMSSPCNPCDIGNNNYDCPIIWPDRGKSIYPNPLMQYLWGVGAFASPPESKNSVPSSGGPVAPTSDTKEKPFSVGNIVGF